MGKRKSNIGGLARYVFETNEVSQPSQSSSSTLGSSSLDHIPADKDGVFLPTVREPEALDTRPQKKQKVETGLLGLGLEKYDASGLVPFYTDASQVPEHLQKYFSQRERYFSLYSSGCLLDEEGWYSVTPECIADQIAERCRCDVILDAFCGVGGNAIAFAKTCERVIALDISPVRLALARHNAALYGVEDRIEFVLADFFSFARTLSAPGTNGKHRGKRKIDVVFLSPPWGGPAYLSSPDKAPSKPQPKITEGGNTDGDASETHTEYSLESIRPVHGAELFTVARSITNNIAYFLPRNSNLDEVSNLVGNGEMVEVEEEWMGSKLKALTCYFGGLVAGQEASFTV